MNKVLLDTDILSAIMRQQRPAILHAQQYLHRYECFTFSLITRYEVLRGLNAKQAVAQLAAFEKLCAVSNILPLTDEIILRAADIYGELHRSGELIGDADILIAATALEHNLTLVMNNENHFARIPNLTIENWIK